MTYDVRLDVITNHYKIAHFYCDSKKLEHAEYFDFDKNNEPLHIKGSTYIDDGVQKTNWIVDFSSFDLGTITAAIGIICDDDFEFLFDDQMTMLAKHGQFVDCDTLCHQTIDSHARNVANVIKLLTFLQYKQEYMDNAVQTIYNIFLVCPEKEYLHFLAYAIIASSTISYEYKLGIATIDPSINDLAGQYGIEPRYVYDQTYISGSNLNLPLRRSTIKIGFGHGNELGITVDFDEDEYMIDPQNTFLKIFLSLPQYIQLGIDDEQIKMYLYDIFSTSLNFTFYNGITDPLVTSPAKIYESRDNFGGAITGNKHINFYVAMPNNAIESYGRYIASEIVWNVRSFLKLFGIYHSSEIEKIEITSYPSNEEQNSIDFGALYSMYT